MTPLGVVAALPAEAEALAGRAVTAGRVVEVTDGVLVHVSGVGRERASSGARELLASGARALLSWGIAGGLDPVLSAGDLLVPGTVLGADGRTFTVDPDWRRALLEELRPRVRSDSCTLVESELVIADAVRKSAVFAATGAAGVDMESAAVAAAALEAGVPFAAIRVVCDAAGASIPKGALLVVDEAGRMRPLALLSFLSRNPGRLPEMIRLGRSYRAARGALREAARRAGPGLRAHS